MVALLAGCGGRAARGPADAATADAAAADGAAPDGAAPDAGVPDARVPDAGVDAAACAEPLEGAEPFGRRLSGTAVFPSASGRPETATIRVDVYFPGGRVAGQRAILAGWGHTTDGPFYFPMPGLITAQAALAVDLSAGPLAIRVYGPDWSVSGALLSGTGGLSADVRVNFASWSSDIVDSRQAHMLLCPTGDAPAATLGVSAYPVAPTSDLWMGSGAPLDESTLTRLAVSAGAPVPTVVTQIYGLVRMRPVAAFPPGQPLTIDVTGARDVLGRAITITEVPHPLKTSATVTDLGFTAAPPVGAVDGDNIVVENGRLIIGQPSDYRPTEALVALGDPGPVTNATLRLQLTCYRSSYTGAALVTASGEVSRIPLPPCGAAAQDVTVTVPGSGPLWLSVTIEQPTIIPQHYLPPPEYDQLAIDQIAFQ